MLDGVRVTYHVHGTGPVCLVYPGGPGFDWRYLRLPMLEEHLTTVYVEPPGSAPACWPTATTPGSGHFAHLEEPDAFRNSVLGFVRRVS